MFLAHEASLSTAGPFQPRHGGRSSRPPRQRVTFPTQPRSRQDGGAGPPARQETHLGLALLLRLQRIQTQAAAKRLVLQSEVTRPLPQELVLQQQLLVLRRAVRQRGEAAAPAAAAPVPPGPLPPPPAPPPAAPAPPSAPSSCRGRSGPPRGSSASCGAERPSAWAPPSPVLPSPPPFTCAAPSPPGSGG